MLADEKGGQPFLDWEVMGGRAKGGHLSWTGR